MQRFSAVRGVFILHSVFLIGGLLIIFPLMSDDAVQVEHSTEVMTPSQESGVGEPRTSTEADSIRDVTSSVVSGTEGNHRGERGQTHLRMTPAVSATLGGRGWLASVGILYALYRLWRTAEGNTMPEEKG